jgi:ATP-dependent RNA helicase DeaD
MQRGARGERQSPAEAIISFRSDVEVAVEQTQDSTGITRSQNQLHVLPEDWGAAEGAIAPLLARGEGQSTTTQIIIVTNDAEAAAGIARRLAPLGADRGLSTLAATEARRAVRVQRAAPAHIVVGPPSALVALLQATVLKLDDVRAVALAWLESLSSDENAALEALMAEMPRDAARVVIANEATPAAEQLVERYARRARRMQPAAPETSPVSLSFVTTSETGRSPILRRVLDVVDPESATVITRTKESRAEVAAILRSLGYDGRSNAVRMAEAPDGSAQLIVLYDLPATADDLRRVAAAAGAARVVALVTPRQVPALRRLAGGAVAPFALPEAAVRARRREDNLREELHEILASGQFSRELLAVEPLLSDYDGAEIAAAAVRLLEAERAKPRAGGPGAVHAMTRLFLNVGEIDGVRAGDIVGAITNEAGIGKTELGRVDVRERGSTVEVATPVANAVIAKLHGVSIKGRRAFVKLDEDRPRRDRPDRPARGDRPDRPRRMGSRGSPSERGGSRKR